MSRPLAFAGVRWNTNRNVEETPSAACFRPGCCTKRVPATLARHRQVGAVRTERLRVQAIRAWGLCVSSSIISERTYSLIASYNEGGSTAMWRQVLAMPDTCERRFRLDQETPTCA